MKVWNRRCIVGAGPTRRMTMRSVRDAAVEGLIAPGPGLGFSPVEFRAARLVPNAEPLVKDEEDATTWGGEG